MENRNVEIVYSSPKYDRSYNQAVNVVAHERKFLAAIQGFPLESTQSFIAFIIENSYSQYFLVLDHKVVGWCDIIPKSIKEFSHVGVLGMGLLKEFRGQGFAEQLLLRAIEHARDINRLEKIELNVFSDNLKAIILYEKIGFVEEGCRIRSRKIDGLYQDELLMAKFLI